MTWSGSKKELNHAFTSEHVQTAMRCTPTNSVGDTSRSKNPPVTLHVSNALLFEYEEVLHREQAILGLTNQQIDDLLNGFCGLGEKHYVSFFWRAVPSDPDDDFMVDLAVAARVTHLITHNLAHLQSARAFGINVVTPGHFLDILRLAYE